MGAGSKAERREKGNLWDATCAESIASQPLPKRGAVDLLIIGGGFTGCSAALHAAGKGARVALLEAETIGFGGSGRNVGLVNAGLWTPPAEVERLLGQAPANKLYKALAVAPDLVFELIQEHEIQCEPVRAGTLHCAHSPGGLKDLEGRAEQLQARGAPVELLDAGEAASRTGAQCFGAALFDPRAGTIQPKAYCVGLARAAQEKGALIHEGASAQRISRAGGAWQVTSGSSTYRAERLLVATNAYHGGMTGVAANAFTPVNYFQLATRPLSSNLRRSILPGGEGCWDTATIMSSFRLDAEGRLIIGGIGSRDSGGGLFHDGWAGRKMADLFPHLAGEPLEYAWHGRIAMTSDHLPKIVRLGEGGFSIYGYSGRGIGPGTTFGKAVAEALLSGDEGGLPLAPVGQHSESFTGIRQAFYETGARLFHLVDRR